jgi:hypothetical protein
MQPLLTNGFTSVDNWGHIGGALGGAIFAHYFGPRIYLARRPEGGNVLVDKPILRLPRYIESIPENTANQWDRVTKMLPFRSDQPSRKPWKEYNRQGVSTKNDYRRRRMAPSKSIKPQYDDEQL